MIATAVSRSGGSTATVFLVSLPVQQKSLFAVRWMHPHLPPALPPTFVIGNARSASGCGSEIRLRLWFRNQRQEKPAPAWSLSLGLARLMGAECTISASFQGTRRNERRKNWSPVEPVTYSKPLCLRLRGSGGEEEEEEEEPVCSLSLLPPSPIAYLRSDRMKERALQESFCFKELSLLMRDTEMKRQRERGAALDRGLLREKCLGRLLFCASELLV